MSSGGQKLATVSGIASLGVMIYSAARYVGL
jgi:hypothetical protein